MGRRSPRPHRGPTIAEASGTPTAWEREFDQWLAPFVDALGDTRRRAMAPAYVRGLLSTSGRKSVAPMATHLAAQDATTPAYHQLQHFVGASPWDPAPLERILIDRANAMVGGPDAMLIVDDTTLLKQGHASVGVGHQYSGAVGKRANCQTLVSLTLAQDNVPVCVSLELYLPSAWTRDAARCRQAGVPAHRRAPQTKIALALAKLTTLRAAGVRFGLVTADAGYGRSADFRRALTAEGLRYAVGIQSHQRVYVPTATTRMPRMAQKAYRADSRTGTGMYPTGRKRVRLVATHARHTVTAVLKTARWRTVTWRDGTQGPLASRFTAHRVRGADGSTGRHGEHMPGDAVWLLGEQQPSGKIKYYFTNHPARTPLRTLVRAIKARWSCEQAHQQLKEELGLDHFEGRSWAGLHHHALLTLISFAFLQHLRLQEHARYQRRVKKNAGMRVPPPVGLGRGRRPTPRSPPFGAASSCGSPPSASRVPAVTDASSTIPRAKKCAKVVLDRIGQCHEAEVPHPDRRRHVRRPRREHADRRAHLVQVVQDEQRRLREPEVRGSAY